MNTCSALTLGVALCACAAPDGSAPSAEPVPTLALDHAWIATAPGAAEERAALERAGFRIAPTINRHDGQGTASATVEFENGFLELIWSDDGVPVSGSGARGKERFEQRADWRRSGHSPFGVALARTPHTPQVLPCETWTVTSEWMQPGTFLEMLTPRGSPALSLTIHPLPVDEAENARRIAAGGEAAWMFLHPNGARRVTALVITAPAPDALPPCAAFVEDSGAVRLELGSEWLMELTLDGHALGREIDLRPALPLIVRHGPAPHRRAQRDAARACPGARPSGRPGAHPGPCHRASLRD